MDGARGLRIPALSLRARRMLTRGRLNHSGSIATLIRVKSDEAQRIAANVAKLPGATMSFHSNIVCTPWPICPSPSGDKADNETDDTDDYCCHSHSSLGDWFRII